MEISGSSLRSQFTRRRFLTLAGSAALGTAADGVITSNDIKLERHHISLPRWDANGFRVAQISDVHMNNAALCQRAHDAVSLAMDLKPDLLVFTGDFLNAASDECLGYVHQVFRRLSEAGCPCLAVPGNHDYTCLDTEGLFAVVAKTPLRLLLNEIVDVAGVSVVGMDDAFFGHARFDATAAAGLSRSTLVLLHEPDYVAELKGEPSLVLSGHSHGGEICLPGGVPIHTPDGAHIYKTGYYANAPTPLYVSRGVGTLGPFRMFCPPEVTLLTILTA